MKIQISCVLYNIVFSMLQDPCPGERTGQRTVHATLVCIFKPSASSKFHKLVLLGISKLSVSITGMNFFVQNGYGILA